MCGRMDVAVPFTVALPPPIVTRERPTSAQLASTLAAYAFAQLEPFDANGVARNTCLDTADLQCNQGTVGAV